MHTTHGLRKQLLLAVILLTAIQSTLAASSPRLTIITPRGIQRGTQHELVFSGARLFETTQILLYDTGVTVTKFEQIDDNQVKVFVDVAADCRLGEHIAQVVTKYGISDYRSFFIGALPQVAEVEPNGDFAQPQKIEMNVTVDGVVQNEDIDYYVVTATKGQRISAEVEAIRLGTMMFDPFVGILNAKRFELAANDDAPIARQDSVVSVLAPEDGDYVVYVRESSYGGNASCRYRLHVGTFPRPTAVFPAGGQPGEEIDVKFLGDVSGEIVRKVTVPPEDQLRKGLFFTDDGGITPSPIPFRSFAGPNLLETGENDSREQAATATALPVAINGIIEKPDDYDFYKFTAKQGEVWDIECLARRLRSGLDPVINIIDPAGKYILGNDDSRGPDSYLRFTVPADGDYHIRVGDHLKRGQADFVYRIEFSKPQPKLTLGIPRTTRYGQERQVIVVPRGNRFASLISASRADFGGPLVLNQAGLPAGVTLVSQPMAANLNLVPAVFEAAEDAPLGGHLVDFTGRHADEATGISGKFYNIADFVLGQPNNAPYIQSTVDKLAVAVVEKVPFRLEIVQPKAPLVRNGSTQIKILVHREEGFDEAITVQFPFRSPGVGTTGSINIPKGANEAYYPLNANGNAQVGSWPMYVIGQTNFKGPAWVSSQLATLEVAEPFVTVTIKRGSVEQGQTTQLYCTVNHTKPFEGEAKAQLIGLPPEVTAAEKTFNKDSTEIVFDIGTTANSPPGNHKTMFCRVIVTHENEPVVSTAGTTEFLISKPVVKKEPVTPAEVKPAEPVPAVAAPPKPLSRLEKLRLESKKNSSKKP